MRRRCSSGAGWSRRLPLVVLLPLDQYCDPDHPVVHLPEWPYSGSLVRRNGVSMSVSLRWLVSRRHLGLTVLAGDDVLDRDIEYVITTELADPTRG